MRSELGEDQGEPVSTDSAAQLERIQQLEREVAGARACLSAAEKELAEHQKLKALGQLIGELAHELSNPLTGILGTVQIVLAAGNVRGDDRAALREVQRMGDQCKTIIENLLRFARREKPATAPLAPQVLLEEALALLRAELEAEKVELVLELDGNTPAIRGHRDYLVQALFGLARVAVRTGVVCPDQRALRVRLIPFGRAVQIEFIDKDRPFRDPSRLFDPFFTTREVEQGLSAGLSIARGIVDEHGGTVSARNEDGVGGVIAIRLPVATEGHRRISSGRHRTPVQRRALVIDDEPVIRKVVERVLADQASATTLMSSADEARDKIK
ncbi:MAG: sensor histidine kinase, partial [Planctomycetota bacterium]